MYEGGIESFVEYLNRNKEVLHPKPIGISGEKYNVLVDIALQYNNSYKENLFTFANNINTKEGGSHLAGFKAALTRSINSYLSNSPKAKNVKEKLSGDDVREGLTAVISVKLPEPQFEGQTKTKLGNSEIKGLVETLVNEGLGTFFEENPPIIKAILERSSMRPGPGKQPGRPRNWRGERGYYRIIPFPGSWPIARKKTRVEVKSSSLREIRQGGRQNRVGIEELRPYYPLKGKS